MFNNLYKNLLNKSEMLSVIGLGYVGLPIAHEFSKKLNVIGFDINYKKIQQYKKGIDATNELEVSDLKESKIRFTSNSKHLQKAKFHIVAVPTPITKSNKPDLKFLKSACEVLGKNLTPGSIVVFESTVYPGVTEDYCAPHLEKHSKLTYGKDFKIGYSPERINPGDKKHRLNNIVKVVSGMDNESLNIIADVYALVVKAGIHKAESIKVAEAAKVIENSQRDINIAFMNELSKIFDKLDINTSEVLKAANTKWNFLDFKPGLVGGHCIGVDPYYLTHCANKLGYKSQVILSGRKINDSMGKYIANKVISTLKNKNISPKKAKVAILGLTFKENCPDIRNTKVMDIYKTLKSHEINPIICDPCANNSEVKLIFGKNLTDVSRLKNLDAIILAVQHKEYKKLHLEDFDKMLNNKIILDIKGILNKQTFEKANYYYWSL